LFFFRSNRRKLFAASFPSPSPLKNALISIVIARFDFNHDFFWKKWWILSRNFWWRTYFPDIHYAIKNGNRVESSQLDCWRHLPIGKWWILKQ
jgi:hypothetical protein